MTKEECLLKIGKKLNTPTIRAAIELGRWLERGEYAPRSNAANPDDIHDWARARGLCTLAHEEMWALGLDARNKVVGAEMVARGGLSSCAIRAADVLRVVLGMRANAFVLVHNHPGGDPCPSADDVKTTHMISEGAVACGMTLVDHVVVATSGRISLLEAGLLS